MARVVPQFFGHLPEVHKLTHCDAKLVAVETCPDTNLEAEGAPAFLNATPHGLDVGGQLGVGAQARQRVYDQHHRVQDARHLSAPGSRLSTHSCMAPGSPELVLTMQVAQQPSPSGSLTGTSFGFRSGMMQKARRKLRAGNQVHNVYVEVGLPTLHFVLLAPAGTCQ